MSVGVTSTAAAPALSGWAALLNAPGGQQRLEVFSSPRPATGAAASGAPMLSAAFPSSPASIVGDELVLSGPGPATLATLGGTPVWARIYGGAGQVLFDLDARLSSEPDNAEEVVVQTTLLLLGAVVRVAVSSIRLPG